MLVDIDAGAGFCGGVIRAIGTAEKYLERNGGTMYSLGSIVHNERELKRLENKGLHSIDKDALDKVGTGEGNTLLIRAHGEPPAVYEQVRAKGFTLIDCTCPVVLKLQKDIREAYVAQRKKTPAGQILIYGKVGHPEVLGLLGQVGGDAVVIERPEHLDDLQKQGIIDFSRDICVFSQTTMSLEDYSRLKVSLAARMVGGASLEIHDTICSQVARRHGDIAKFAFDHDVVVFVSGKHSSNGRVLSDLCHSCNPRTYDVCSAVDLKREWFRPDDRVGVSGATSTPAWLLEEVAQGIENLQ